MAGQHVVLGASGGTGGALVCELAARGHAVTAVTRSGRLDGAPDGVRVAAADVTDAEQVRRVARGAAAVFHAAQPPYHRWVAEFPAMTGAILRGVEGTGARLVLADNLYSYGAAPDDAGWHAGRPLQEDLPTTATSRKGRLRARMAADLLAAHAAGRVEVVLARSSSYYGPGGLHTNAGERVFDVALRGGKAQLPGRLDRPHTWSYLPDMARAMVTLAERPEASGGVWHLPAAEPVTGAQFLDLVYAAAGTAPRYGATPRWLLRAVGVVNPLVRELPETLFEFEQPYVVDASRYQAAFGPFTPTRHAEAVAATVDWFRRRAAAPRAA